MFITPSTQSEMMKLSLRFGFMMAEAQMVIGMRMMGMAGMWRTTPAETSRMFSEKLAATGEATMAASLAMLQGKSAAVVADLALKPIGRRTQANVRRLARRGPGKS